MFARLTDGHRIAIRSDRCGDSFLSACALAAAAMFWLRVHGLGLARFKPLGTAVRDVQRQARIL